MDTYQISRWTDYYEKHSQKRKKYTDTPSTDPSLFTSLFSLTISSDQVLVVPINERDPDSKGPGHWYLAVLRSTSDGIRIYFMDSMGRRKAAHGAIITTLEYCLGKKFTNKKTFVTSDTQKNTIDCGVYMLFNIEYILANPNRTLECIAKHSFTLPCDAVDKRKQISQDLTNWVSQFIGKELNGWDNLQPITESALTTDPNLAVIYVVLAIKQECKKAVGRWAPWVDQGRSKLILQKLMWSF